MPPPMAKMPAPNSSRTPPRAAIAPIAGVKSTAAAAKPIIAPPRANRPVTTVSGPADPSIRMAPARTFMEMAMTSIAAAPAKAPCMSMDAATRMPKDPASTISDCATLSAGIRLNAISGAASIPIAVAIRIMAAAPIIDP